MGIQKYIEPLTKVLALPQAYEAWAMVHLPPRIQLIRNCVPELKAGDRILELGCGPGTTAKYFPECQYTGVDVSQEYLDYATNKYGPRFPTSRFLYGDISSAETLADEKQSFDLVLLQGAVHHLPPEVTEQCIKNMRRYVKPGGSVLILDQVNPEKNERARLRKALIQLDRGKFTRFQNELEKLLRDQGFQISATKSITLGLGPVAFWKYVAVKGH